MRKLLSVLGYMVTLPFAVIFAIVYGLTVFHRSYWRACALAWQTGRKAASEGVVSTTCVGGLTAGDAESEIPLTGKGEVAQGKAVGNVTHGVAQGKPGRPFLN